MLVHTCRAIDVELQARKADDPTWGAVARNREGRKATEGVGSLVLPGLLVAEVQESDDSEGDGAAPAQRGGATGINDGLQAALSCLTMYGVGRVAVSDSKDPGEVEVAADRRKLALQSAALVVPALAAAGLTGAFVRDGKWPFAGGASLRVGAGTATVRRGRRKKTSGDPDAEKLHVSKDDVTHIEQACRNLGYHLAAELDRARQALAVADAAQAHSAAAAAAHESSASSSSASAASSSSSAALSAVAPSVEPAAASAGSAATGAAEASSPDVMMVASFAGVVPPAGAHQPPPAFSVLLAAAGSLPRSGPGPAASDIDALRALADAQIAHLQKSLAFWLAVKQGLPPDAAAPSWASAPNEAAARVQPAGSKRARFAVGSSASDSDGHDSAPPSARAKRARTAHTEAPGGAGTTSSSAMAAASSVSNSVSRPAAVPRVSGDASADAEDDDEDQRSEQSHDTSQVGGAGVDSSDDDA